MKKEKEKGVPFILTHSKNQVEHPHPSTCEKEGQFLVKHCCSLFLFLRLSFFLYLSVCCVSLLQICRLRSIKLSRHRLSLSQFIRFSLSLSFFQNVKNRCGKTVFLSTSLLFTKDGIERGVDKQTERQDRQLLWIHLDQTRPGVFLPWKCSTDRAAKRDFFRQSCFCIQNFLKIAKNNRTEKLGKQKGKKDR
jgi:hypothetical protein